MDYTIWPVLHIVNPDRSDSTYKPILAVTDWWHSPRGGGWGIDKEDLGGGHWLGNALWWHKKEAGTVICAFAHLQVQRCNKTMQAEKKMQKMPSEYTCSRLFFCIFVWAKNITALGLFYLFIGQCPDSVHHSYLRARLYFYLRTLCLIPPDPYIVGKLRHSAFFMCY